MPNQAPDQITQPSAPRRFINPGVVITAVITVGITISLTALAIVSGGFATPQSVSAGESRLTLPVMVHLATVVPALLLGPFILWRKKGDALHKLLGRVWATLMVITAVASAFIVAPGGGIAGTGYFFLRAYDAELTPPILILEPDSCWEPVTAGEPDR